MEHEFSEEPEFSGDYFVSITDLMTGVVFIFVILLTAYALNFRAAQERSIDESKRSEIVRNEAQTAKEALERQKTALGKLEIDIKAKERALLTEKEQNQSKAEQIDALAKLLRDREQTRRQMLIQLTKKLQNDYSLKVSVDLDNGVIRLPESLLFAQGKADIRGDGLSALRVIGKEIVASIDRFCPRGGDFQLEALFVEGHTDSLAINNDEFGSNWELSTARAVNTSTALFAAAPQLLTILNPSNSPIVGVSGYGEFRPVANNKTEQGQKQNRRIDLRFIAAYPSAEQLKRVHDILNPSK